MVLDPTLTSYALPEKVSGSLISLKIESKHTNLFFLVIAQIPEDVEENLENFPRFLDSFLLIL